MGNSKAVLVLNENDLSHKDVLLSLLQNATHFECVVAFAKKSGLGLLIRDLRSRLEQGMTARFSIGLSFYQTDPELLNDLVKLKGKYDNLQIYISNSAETFHPKIYAISHARGESVLIGSANFTAGGLHKNYEASALIKNPTKKITKSVIEHINVLINSEILIPATPQKIDDYAVKYKIAKIQQNKARLVIEKSINNDEITFTSLNDLLVLMKADKSEHGFEAARITRRNNRARVPDELREFARAGDLSEEDFIARYRNLIRLFQSGFLYRSQTKIAAESQRFQAALSNVNHLADEPPEIAYAHLRNQFEGIDGAGVNLITEILHGLNNKQFAVMNQNSVSGMRLASIDRFQSHPTKQGVTPETYAVFCNYAGVLRRQLGLEDFSELDALFNYAYWDHVADSL